MSNTTLGIDVGKYELAVALRKDGKFTDKLVENNPRFCRHKIFPKTAKHLI